MEFYRGRLLDHVQLRVRDLEASKRFYRAVLSALGQGGSFVEGDGNFYADELFVDVADGEVTHAHLAFQAEDKDAVHAFYRAAMASGGKDNGAPGERSYHPGYYAAFAIDPDGNNVEAVYHGPAKRSVESVVLTSTES